MAMPTFDDAMHWRLFIPAMFHPGGISYWQRLVWAMPSFGDAPSWRRLTPL